MSTVFWSMLSMEWEEQTIDVLLEMLVNQYVTVRGFSFASMMIEKFKQVSKKTTQKTKGIRKGLTGDGKETEVVMERKQRKGIVKRR